MSKFQNPIKWSGSKSSLSKQIVEQIPYSVNGTYYEPFCGSCSVLFEILTNLKQGYLRNRITKYQCSDINKDLIDLWNAIKEKPLYLHHWYSSFWDNFNYNYSSIPLPTDKLYQNRKDNFNVVRGLYNRIDGDWSEQKYVLLLFLTRTAFNGLLRFNNKGEYNSTCHFSRPGIHPDKMKEILFNASDILNAFNVEFKHINYVDIKPEENDFVFLDPPYSDSDKKKMYYGTIDERELIDYCNNLPCSYGLTYNGDRGNNKGKRLALNDTKEVLLEAKNSSYSKMNGEIIKVKEILYIKD